MVSLYFINDNFARVHQTLRVTPAMEAGVSAYLWSIDEIVGAAQVLPLNGRSLDSLKGV